MKHLDEVKSNGGPLRGFIKSVFSKNIDAKTFNEAFAEARSKNLEYFKWNGKRYNTKLAQTPNTNTTTNSQNVVVKPVKPDLNVAANFTGQVENPDSVGYNKATRTWSSPTLPGYDPNQIGMGIDRNTNIYLKDYERQPNAVLSEDREREVRLQTIQGLEKQYNNRIAYAKTLFPDFDGNLSQHKVNLLYQALYKSPKAVANWWERDTIQKFINATDDEATKLIKDFHQKYFTQTYKGRNRALDRALSTTTPIS